MIFPPPDVMALLVALNQGCRIDVADGRLVMQSEFDTGHTSPEWLAGALDALEERGWVAIGTAGVTVTENGSYAYDRWRGRRELERRARRFKRRRVA